MKRSARTVWLNNVCNCTRKRSDTQRGCRAAAKAVVGRRFEGAIMNHHGNKQRKIGVTACGKVQQVHSQTSLTASHDITSFVDLRRVAMRWPPA